MASVKSLTRNTGQTHCMSSRSSMSEPTFTKQNQPSWCKFLPSKTTFSTSSVSAHKKLTSASAYFLPHTIMTPTRTKECVFHFGNISMPSESSVDSTITMHREKNLPMNSSIFSSGAAADGGVAISANPPSLKYSDSGKTNCIPCSSIITSCKLPMATKQRKQDHISTEIFDPEISLRESNVVPSNSSDMTTTFDKRATAENKESAKMSSLGLENLSYNNSLLKGNSCSSCDTENQKREVTPTMNGNTSHCAFKLITNLALVLSAPRKTAKKGRPSSKKQKKRQREKQKQAILVAKETSNPSQMKVEIKQNLPKSRCLTLTSNLSDELAHSFLTSPSELKNGREERFTPVKSPSKLCPIAHLFFRLNSSSEENDDDADDYDGSTEWSVNEYKGVYFSPIKSYGFNFALNLDSIFKHKSIPSLKGDCNSAGMVPSVSYVKNDPCQKLNDSRSVDDCHEEGSFEISALPTSFEPASSDFVTGLSQDILFSKKPNAKIQTAENYTENTVDLEDLPSSDSSSPHGTDVEALNRINAKWNENYPTTGFRSCYTAPEDAIQNPSIKVHFAKEPHLLTVHNVGTEDRAGTWHHFALDRERFERRILEVARIISPVLEGGHRAKILEHRYCHEEH